MTDKPKGKVLEFHAGGRPCKTAEEYFDALQAHLAQCEQLMSVSPIPPRTVLERRYCEEGNIEHELFVTIGELGEIVVCDSFCGERRETLVLQKEAARLLADFIYAVFPK